MKSTYLLSLSFAATLLLSGCGSDSSSNPANEEIQNPTSINTDTLIDPTDIMVERGPVLGATVVDSNGTVGEEQGNGIYRFYNPQYPIQSLGGFIDVNRNGTIDAGDMNMSQLQLSTAEGNVMTLATTMAQNSELYQAMLELGLSADKLLNERPSTDMDNAALSDEIYKYCVENNVSDPATITTTAMQELQNRIQERINQYKGSLLTQPELEEQLITQELNLTTLDESTTLSIDFNKPHTQEDVIASLPEYDLNDTQKEALAYMWNEEKMAKDIYTQLDALYGSNTLSNIANRSETQHEAMIEALIEKYDLDILSTDYSSGYDAEALEAYGSGTYSIDDITALYDTLYAKGSQSLQDALEVGCMIEVTDIADLETHLAQLSDTADLKTVFESLKSASGTHYNAFDTALKNMGVTEGCCVLGDEYCLNDIAAISVLNDFNTSNIHADNNNTNHFGNGNGFNRN